MALVKWCKECGRQISDKAYICPSCGAPVGATKEVKPTKATATKATKKSSTAGIIALLSILLVFLVIGVGVYAYSTLNNKEDDIADDSEQDDVLMAMEIDGQTLDYTGPQPILIDGAILAPVAVFESLGYTVVWDKETETAILTNGSNTIIIEVGENEFTTNGDRNSISIPAQMIDDNLMLPIEAILESVGHSASWDDSRKIVSVSTALEFAEPPPETTPEQPAQPLQTSQVAPQSTPEQSSQATSKTAQESTASAKDSATVVKFEQKNDINLVAGETFTRTATASPLGKITYQSSDPSVASVDGNGKVTAKKMGTAKITASSGNGSASYTVNVLVLVTITIDVTFEQNYDVDLMVGETFTRKATATPSGAIYYRSSDPSVASVDANGKVVANGPGNARITAYSDDDSDSYRVTVYQATSSSESADPIAPNPGHNPEGSTSEDDLLEETSSLDMTSLPKRE